MNTARRRLELVKKMRGKKMEGSERFTHVKKAAFTFYLPVNLLRETSRNVTKRRFAKPEGI